MPDDFMLDTDGIERRMSGAFSSLKTEFASTVLNILLSLDKP